MTLKRFLSIRVVVEKVSVIEHGSCTMYFAGKCTLLLGPLFESAAYCGNVFVGITYPQGMLPEQPTLFQQQFLSIRYKRIRNNIMKISELHTSPTTINATFHTNYNDWTVTDKVDAKVKSAIEHKLISFSSPYYEDDELSISKFNADDVAKINKMVSQIMDTPVTVNIDYDNVSS